MTKKTISHRKEIFKDIPGYEGLYQVTNQGRVFSILNNKFLIAYLNPNKYYMVGLYKNKIRKPKKIHRLVAECFLGSSILTVDHINGIKTDNNISNLRYLTSRENTIAARDIRIKRNVPQGVYKTRHDTYIARITINLGIYKSKEDAGKAYRKAAAKLIKAAENFIK